MPMPTAAPSKTARKRSSLACRACWASVRAVSAERAMASCSLRVRSRSARAYPAAMACWSRAQREWYSAVASTPEPSSPSGPQ